MKNLFLIVLASVVIQSCQNNTPSNLLQVGASQKNITPNAGAYIAGDAINRQFTGIHDSLYVKALVVSDENNSLVIISFDCIGLLYPELLRIREEVSKLVAEQKTTLSVRLDPNHIVMTSTHTHTGPDVVGIWGPEQLKTGIDSNYQKYIIKQAASAILEAWINRSPAIATYAETIYGQDWVYNISDSLSLDRSLTAIQFKASGGKSIATITSFACHPTIMDGATTLVSADYLNGLYTQLDQKLGGVNLFLQGAIGGWVQPEYEKKKFEIAEKRGKELGEKVENILQKSISLDSNSIRFRSKTIQLPISNQGFQQLAAAGIINRTITDSVTTEIAWFSIGNASFATHPGETTPVHSLQTKNLMKTKGPRIVIGFGMDAVGYMLSPEFFKPGNKLKHTDYLLSMSISKEAGPVLMKRIAELANN